MEAYPQVLDALKAWFDARGDENARTEVDGVPMLRAMVPLLGGGRGLVLMEIFVIPYGEGTELLQFYTTVTKEDGPGMDDLRRAASCSTGTRWPWPRTCRSRPGRRRRWRPCTSRWMRSPAACRRPSGF